MDLKKIFEVAKKLDIKFVDIEEATKQDKSSIVLRNFVPKGIYIPFSDIPRLIKLGKELLEKSKKQEIEELKNFFKKEDGSQ